MIPTKFKLLFFIGFVLFGCKLDKKEPTEQAANTSISTNQKAPEFNEQNAFDYIEKQVNFGPRVPNSEAHAACAAYLEGFFNDLGLTTQIQSAAVKAYDGKKLNIKNITARFAPEKPNRIVLFAHWDSRHIADRDIKDLEKPILGANDGASGVGVIMEIIQSIVQSAEKPNIGIDIVLFDAEDYGQPNNSTGQMPDTWALGSQYWSKNISFGPNYTPRYGVLLDMVGAQNAVFPKEGHSMRHASHVVDKIWKNASSLGYSNYFVNDMEPYGITDDHKYVNELAAIPTVDIIHYDVHKRDFGSFHHTHNDNMQVIHKATLKAVGQTLLTVIYSEP